MLRVEELNHYEMIIILRDDLTVPELDNEIENFIKLISKPVLDGSLRYYPIHDIEKLGLKKLAYEIKRGRRLFTKGYYLKITFSIEPIYMSLIEDYSRHNDNVLKFIIVRIDDKAILGSDLIYQDISDQAVQEGENNKNKIPDAFDILFPPCSPEQNE